MTALIARSDMKALHEFVEGLHAIDLSFVWRPVCFRLSLLIDDHIVAFVKHVL